MVGRKAKGRVVGKPSLKEAVIPPPPPTPGRKRRKKKKKKQSPSKGSAGSQSASKVGQTPQKKRKTPPGVIREPRTAAVLLSAGPEAEITLGEVLKKTRPLAAEIPGITPVTLKRAQAGGVLLQLSGGEGHRLADDLAAKMRQVVGEAKGVRVARPQRRAELRLQGLDDSVTREEVIGSVAGLAGCRAEDLVVGEIKSLPNRLGSVWLRCPVAVSNKLIEEGKWRIEWATVAAKPLPARQMRCF